jgi:phosphatidate cytidylyltransferase
MSRELQLRIVSAVVLAAIVLAATWVGGTVFAVVAAIISLLIFYEWTSITGQQKLASRLTAFGWASVVVVAVETVFRGAGWPVAFSMRVCPGFRSRRCAAPAKRG